MKTITLHITDDVGTHHTLEAPTGWRAMEVIRDYGLPMRAECGGACACATCHVYVAADWVGKLVPPSGDEALMLEDVTAPSPTSRLSCQIVLASELDGLALTLA